MRWDDFRRSDNVEDDRGDSGGRRRRLRHSDGRRRARHRDRHRARPDRLGARHRSEHLDRRRRDRQRRRLAIPAAVQPANRRIGAPTDQMGQFVAAVLGDTEDTWSEHLPAERPAIPRAEAAAVLPAREQGGCGFAQSAMGPFYCPPDQRVYLDTSFFREMQTRFRACTGKACEFAEAYVIAHEVGHHVQNLLGILPKAQAAQQAAGSKAGANRIQVRVELQADCFAGVWAQSFRPAQAIHRAGRRRGGVADRGRDRRRPPAEQRGLCGADASRTASQRQRWFTPAQGARQLQQRWFS